MTKSANKPIYSRPLTGFEALVGYNPDWMPRTPVLMKELSVKRNPGFEKGAEHDRLIRAFNNNGNKSNIGKKY